MPTISKSLLNATAYATLFELLVKDGGTVPDMREETGFTYPTIGKILKILHKRRVIRVSSWERDVMGRPTLRVWQMANGKPDAPRPPSKSLTGSSVYYAKQQQVALVTGGRVREARLSHIKQTPLGMKAAA